MRLPHPNDLRPGVAISFEEALAITIASAIPTPPERLPLLEALGKVLAEDLITPFPVPRFDNSAVDGYALPGDAEGVFIQDRTIACGEDPGAAVEPGRCARVFTGAPTPSGAFAVVMQENVVVDGTEIQIAKHLLPGENIRRAGEEFPQGSDVLKSGTQLNPAGIALAATMGHTHVAVYRSPAIALIVTGAELVAAGSALGEGQIYESNSYAISGGLRSLGLTPTSVEVIGDDLELTMATLRRALDHSDLVITTGGVSVGDRDFVKEALTKLGVRKGYWNIALKPGKPVYFGTRGQTAVFALPGNPLAALATFFLLVEPYIKASMRHPEPRPLCLPATLSEDTCHRLGRREFLPGNLSVGPKGFQVAPILNQRSHMLGGLARANSLIDLPADVAQITAGMAVSVLPLGPLQRQDSKPL